MGWRVVVDRAESVPIREAGAPMGARKLEGRAMGGRALEPGRRDGWGRLSPSGSLRGLLDWGAKTLALASVLVLVQVSGRGGGRVSGAAQRAPE